MNDSEFEVKIDRFLDGTLDFVEWSEFREHERTNRACTRKLLDQFWERFGNGIVTFGDIPPQECLSDATLQRFASDDLPSQLLPTVTRHIVECHECADRAMQSREA